MSVYIDGQVVAVGERAVLIRIKAVGTRSATLEPQPEEWIPFSQIEESCVGIEDLEKDIRVEMKISDYVATERGLV